MGNRWCVLAWFLLWPALGRAQPAEPAPDRSVKCAFQQEDQPSYILWLCNPEGTAPSEEASVLWVRTNAAGAEVMTAVWHGESDELLARSGTIIERHRRAHAGCKHFVHLARARGRQITWNTAPPGAVAALKAAAAPDTAVCYAQEPGSADYVILWATRSAELPNAFTVVIPGSADTSAPSSLTPGLPRRAVPGPSRPVLAIHRVDPGMDNSILRLGLSVFSIQERQHGSNVQASPFAAALSFLGRTPGDVPTREPTTGLVQ